MGWESILKADIKKSIREIEKLVGEEGDLDDIMRMIDKEFGVKTKILYDSSSQPVLGFELPIFVSCRMGTKDRPGATEKFTVKSVGINKSEIR